MKNNTTDKAGVLVFPPVIYLAGLLLGLLTQWFHPIRFLPKSLSVWSGIPLMLSAIPTVLFAVRALKRVRTAIDVRKPTTTIVTNGIFRVSRNPMYVALTLLYLGIGFWVNSLWIVLFVVPVIIFMNQGVIKREEKYLERKFGNEYLQYKSKVRRWI